MSSFQSSLDLEVSDPGSLNVRSKGDAGSPKHPLHGLSEEISHLGHVFCQNWSEIGFLNGLDDFGLVWAFKLDWDVVIPEQQEL